METSLSCDKTGTYDNELDSDAVEESEYSYSSDADDEDEDDDDGGGIVISIVDKSQKIESKPKTHKKLKFTVEANMKQPGELDEEEEFIRQREHAQVLKRAIKASIAESGFFDRRMQQIGKRQEGKKQADCSVNHVAECLIFAFKELHDKEVMKGSHALETFAEILDKKAFILDSFCTYLSEKKRIKAASIKTYLIDLKQFLRFYRLYYKDGYYIQTNGEYLLEVIGDLGRKWSAIERRETTESQQQLDVLYIYKPY